MSTLISSLSALVTFLFTAMVLDQYLERRRPHQAVWAVALLLFGLAVSLESIAGASGWSVTLYRLWFLFGAALAAATLGLGTLFLLVPIRWAKVTSLLLAPAACWAAYRVLTVPIVAGAVIPPPGQARPPSVQAIPADLTVLVVVLNGLGTLAVVGGALWSAWLFWRSRERLYRVLSNLLIAGGALVVAASGSLAGLGRPEFLFLGEFAGISLIFAGFLRSQPSVSIRSLPLFRRLSNRPGSWTPSP